MAPTAMPTRPPTVPPGRSRATPGGTAPERREVSPTPLPTASPFSSNTPLMRTVLSRKEVTCPSVWRVPFSSPSSRTWWRRNMALWTMVSTGRVRVRVTGNSTFLRCDRILHRSTTPLSSIDLLSTSRTSTEPLPFPTDRPDTSFENINVVNVN